jgi:hypothetical protein
MSTLTTAVSTPKDAPGEAAKGATAPGAAGESSAGPKVVEAKVRGESLYDRISSFLMAVVIGTTIVVLWIGVVYLTDQSFKARATAPVQIVEVFGGGGGSPDGTPGSTQSIDVAGAEVGPFASNNTEEPAQFEEPSMQQAPAAMLDYVDSAADEITEVDVAEATPYGGAVATGKRMSKLGTGGPAFGFGPGDGGVPREQRWSIVFNPGQTVDEYARQLDFLGVELGTISNNAIVYASGFAGTPRTRSGSSESEKRLYFLWRGQGRKSSDVELLRRAGIEVGEGVIFQFYPKQIEDALAQIEVKYRGRQPAEIRSTRFAVVSSGSGYGFEVISQEPLR